MDIDIQLANGLLLDGDGRLSGEGVLRVRLMDKGDAVIDAGKMMGASKRDIISVGNSRYDVSMFEKSAFGIAFCPSDEEVRRRADAVVERKDLTEIIDIIDNRVPR